MTVKMEMGAENATIEIYEPEVYTLEELGNLYRFVQNLLCGGEVRNVDVQRRG